MRSPSKKIIRRKNTKKKTKKQKGGEDNVETWWKSLNNTSKDIMLHLIDMPYDEWNQMSEAMKSPYKKVMFESKEFLDEAISVMKLSLKEDINKLKHDIELLHVNIENYKSISSKEFSDQIKSILKIINNKMNEINKLVDHIQNDYIILKYIYDERDKLYKIDALKPFYNKTYEAMEKMN